MFDLTDKVGLITGATGGIGGAIARAMKSNGATVVVSGRNESKLAQEFDGIEYSIHDNTVQGE